MGRKGVSKRKPKKSPTNDNNNRGSSNSRPGESPSSVQSLVNARESPLNQGGRNPSTGSNKKNRKGR
jgi:hypothetical protein